MDESTPTRGRPRPRPHRAVHGHAQRARCNSVIAEDFARLSTAGKPHKVAVAAWMRKLLTILNALVRDNALWGEKKSKNIPIVP